MRIAPNIPTIAEVLLPGLDLHRLVRPDGSRGHAARGDRQARRPPTPRSSRRTWSPSLRRRGSSRSAARPRSLLLSRPERRQRPNVPHLNPRKYPQSAHYSSETWERRFTLNCVVGPGERQPRIRSALLSEAVPRSWKKILQHADMPSIRLRARSANSRPLSFELE
jgi:hypothetical protein